METGSISKWLLKEGDKFSSGQAICEVETDKASVTYEATDEGYLAKIIAGSGDIKVGSPMMITVEEEEDVKAFADYQVADTPAPAPSSPSPSSPPPPPTPSTPAPVAAPTPSPSPVTAPSGGRVFASPFARKLASEASIPISALFPGSGPNNRIIAADVEAANISMPAHASASTPLPSGTPATAAATPPPSPSPGSLIGGGGAYVDFTVSPMAQIIASQLAVAKQTVPHYYLSVELDLSKVMALRSELNEKLVRAKSSVEISVQDMIVKAAALAVKQVPDVNASWFDEGFIRRYDNVDINMIMSNSNGSSGVMAPVLKNTVSKGFSEIASQMAEFQAELVESESEREKEIGTFSVHNLGIYGVKSFAPIVLTPQACALALGAISDTVVPNVNSKEGEDNWKVAPVMIATLSCDHRVVDGAVGAQYLAAFKSLVENPITMLV
eukprot:CAMPEP_0182422326 /NCGR_PEP_ID=MMETSP1167-20130531/7977_1 /TAXON_ID=2988 /ORGANISM="Mallomonas Sp, Strain CCMP3275" /LENGTH=440 /DNA_ID=CAMNT_0024600293 /DNA_START=259 /DNA_END=1581 /DNA_ORIENTATION=-